MILDQWRVIHKWEWDLMIVLDALRYDVANKHIPKRLGGGRLYKARSRGSCTPEWFSNTFTQGFYDWVYVSGNVFIASYPVSHPLVSVHAGSRFYRVIDAHRVGWRRIGCCYTVCPKTVTVMAVTAHRIHRGRKMIVHYIQPHAPYPFAQDLSKYFVDDEMRADMKLWEAMKKGELEPERVIEAYEETLEWVLGFVEDLLASTKWSTAIITSDHGEAFGEDGLYDHPPSVDHPVLREVPVYVIAQS